MIIIIIKAELFIYVWMYLFLVKLILCQSFKVQFFKNMTPFVQMRECSINHLVIFVAQKLHVFFNVIVFFSFYTFLIALIGTFG